eukprot:5164575-Lingulodinium_polyedra.AAC.1
MIGEELPPSLVYPPGMCIARGDRHEVEGAAGVVAAVSVPFGFEQYKVPPAGKPQKQGSMLGLLRGARGP